MRGAGILAACGTDTFEMQTPKTQASPPCFRPPCEPLF